MCRYSLPQILTLSAVISFIGIGLSSAKEPTPIELFESRIMPIFNSPEPSSCVQCHLSSVDLKDYILPSSQDTFLALRDQGLVNVESPEDSKILNLISMGDLDDDRLAKRIHAKTRQAEYEAFRAWIQSCCEDVNLVTTKRKVTEEAGPDVTNKVIRHSRKDRVLDSFVRNIWSQRMRCFPCHTPGDIDPKNPMHKQPAERYKEFVAKYGQRMNVFKETPEATLRALAASSRRTHKDALPLLNVEDPMQSLLLLKPTARLPGKGEDGKLLPPSSVAPVSHMGGIKMHKDDFSYKAFANWLIDYAAATQGGYVADKELPLDNWYPTMHVLRIKNAPQDWENMATVQLFVQAWNEESEAFEKKPIAFTQSKVTPRKIINGTLFMLANDKQKQAWNPEGEQLAPGRYRIQAFLDREEAIQDSPGLMLNENKPDAQWEIDASWKEGFKNAQIIDNAAP